MKPATSINSVKGDRAISKSESDRLGFRNVAARVAAALVDHSIDGGIVVGLEGRWGSGKSSLLFLIEDELSRLSEARRPTVINFKPWLIGDRDALLRNLFTEFSAAIDRLKLARGDATADSVAKVKKAAEAMRKFTSALTRTGELIEVVGDATAIPGVKLFGLTLKAAKQAIPEKAAEEPLDRLKTDLTEALRALNHRIIVTIDDVDRLEPSEIVEVLRLTRSVADFPNVVYVLCYDSEILAHGIKEAAKVENGYNYLEKIVQLTIPVPQPESFQLRNWFATELREFATPFTDEGERRLKSVIDFEGGRQLRTPRAVVRVLDSLRFFWPSLREGKADLADLVWLQLIKDGNPRLYRWIENYSAAVAATSLGTAMVDEEEQKRELEELMKVGGVGYFNSDLYRTGFAEILPGMEASFGQEEPLFTLYGKVEAAERNKAIRTRRLASPDHYKLYFALTDPSHALSQAEADAFWLAVEADPEEVAAQLLGLHVRVVSGSYGRADLLLDRILGGDTETLLEKQAAHILLAFAAVLDAAYRARPFERTWTISLWDRAEKLVPVLLRLLSPEMRANVIRSMFEQGASISWLTHLYRHDVFAQGKFGTEQKPEAQWLFTSAEYNDISAIMTARYRAMSFDEIMDTIEGLRLLWTWKQGGDENGPRELIAPLITTDEGLIRILERLATAIGTSSGELRVLKLDRLSMFMDAEAARNRATALANSAPGLVRDQAKEIVEKFELGDQY